MTLYWLFFLLWFRTTQRVDSWAKSSHKNVRRDRQGREWHCCRHHKYEFR